MDMEHLIAVSKRLPKQHRSKVMHEFAVAALARRTPELSDALLDATAEHSARVAMDALVWEASFRRICATSPAVA